MTTAYDFSARGIDGTEVSLEQFRGQALLIVNTASKCGFTGQYAGLEALHRTFAGKPFEVLGFPCNQFGAQEPGGVAEIEQTCLINYGVSFPMFQKVDVNGSGAHPIFDFLTHALPGWFGRRIKWNLTKFLIGRDGVPVKRFAPITTPDHLDSPVRHMLGV